MEPSTSTRNAVCTASTLLRLLPLSHFPPSFSLSIPPTHGSRSRVRFGIIPLQMGACGCSRTQIGSLFLQLEASRDFGGISAIFELGETRKSQVPPALRSSARTERAHHVSII